MDKTPNTSPQATANASQAALFGASAELGYDMEDIAELLDGVPADGEAFPTSEMKPEPLPAPPHRKQTPKPAEPASAPHAPWPDLLEQDKEIYAALGKFLKTSDAERMRELMRGRSLESQADFYRFVVENKVHPDDHFMIALQLLGLYADFARRIPENMQGAIASTVGDIKAAVNAAMAPYGSVPAELQQLTSELDQASERVSSAARAFVDDSLAEMQQQLIDSRSETGELADRIADTLTDAKSQMLAALEGMVHSIQERQEKSTKDSLAELAGAKDKAIAEMAKASKAHVEALERARIDHESKLAGATGTMVTQAASLAREIAQNAMGFKRQLWIFGAGVAVGMIFLYLAKH